MENFKRDKIERVLGIYTKLLNGHVIDKRSDVSTQWFMTEEKRLSFRTNL